MRRLRVQFGIFFALLSFAFGVLIWNSYRQMEVEELSLWRGQAERVYNQMQATISDFLTAEDRRPLEEYQSQTSPLASLPADDTRGLIGYFQMGPDGDLTTPQGFRKERIQDLTSSLKPSPQAPSPSKAKGYVELGKMADLLKKSEAKEGERFAQNVYPNPIQEQAARFEEKKLLRMKAPAMAKQAEAPAGAAAPAPATASMEDRALDAAPEAKPLPPSKPESTDSVGSAFSPPPPPPSPTPPTSANHVAPPAFPADPFQARLVEDKFLVFYRKAPKSEGTALQGFVIDAEIFFKWLMEQSFANSELPNFAVSRLEIEERPLAQYGVVEFPTGRKSPFFERALGFPLNLFVWRVYAASLPHAAARAYLNFLAGGLVLLLVFGFYLTYRAAASQVLLSQKRQDFVSAVTHELKTPLTSIRMYSEMLEDGWAKDDEKRREYYGHISKESGRLSRLIENVLQLARLEKKTYRLNLKKENPSKDFSEIAQELKAMAERQGFPLSLYLPENLPPAVYDPEAVKQILLSLLENSMKFSSEAFDKSLEMALLQEKDEVILSWGDRGPGIPSSDLGKIFDDFYRGEGEMTRKTKGTGIGLAICRMLAHAMGAKISARNRDGGGLEIRLAMHSH